MGIALVMVPAAVGGDAGVPDLVVDIGLALSPVAYFAQFDLDAPCVAMVTASHNENGWTGVKMGAQRPLTFGPAEMGRLKEIVLGGQGVSRPGGSLTHVQGFAERYIADVSSRVSIKRPLKVIARRTRNTPTVKRCCARSTAVCAF